MSDPTVTVYDARARDYAAMTADLGERVELEAFADALPEGGHVLDLGCGPGFYAAWLAARGFTVRAVDASAEMVALAAALPGVNARQARFDEIDAEGAYDGIWANFSLLHAPRTDLPAHLARLRRALRPGGLFHIGMKLGSGEGADRIGRFYAYYGEEELLDLLHAAGLDPISSRRGSGKGLDGLQSEHITVLARG